MRSNPCRSLGVIVSIAALAALAAPAQAGAARAAVGVSNGVLTFLASPGFTNTVRIFKISIPPGDFYGVDDANLGATALELATGCGNEAGAVRCGDYRQPGGASPTGGVHGFRVALGDGDDSFLLDASAPFTTVTVGARVNGGPGNDRITTAEGPDVIVGGPGANTVRAGAGNDRVSLRNGVRDLLVDCGTGVDTAILDRNDPKTFGCETVLRPG
jgi:Ca2+-binding RTX toxin-like protein